MNKKLHVKFDFLFCNDNEYFAFPVPGYLHDLISEFIGTEPAFPMHQIHDWAKIEFDYLVDDQTSMKDLISDISYRLGITGTFYNCSSPVMIQTELDFVRITEYNISIKKIISLLEIDNQINMFFVFSSSQGEIWREGQIRYFFHSSENTKHNKPHIHVRVGSENVASVDILTGKVLAGKLMPKYERKILEKIKKNQRYLLSCWNSMTDGLEYDVDYGLRKRR